MKIVFLDAYTTNPGDISLNDLEGLGEFKAFDRSSKVEGIQRGKDADVIITNKYVVDSDVLKSWNKCKLICVAATGYDNVDLESCERHDVQVSNVRDYSTASVVQYVFSTLLSVIGRSSHYHDEVRNGRWQKSIDFTFMDHSIEELNGLTLGVWGLGTIGQKVGQIANAFGMNVMAINKYPEVLINGIRNVSEKEFFQESDIVSLHVPLNSSTHHMINSKVLSQLKTNVKIINTSRGGVIDELALADFLRSNSNAVAILDVLSNEPPQNDNPLINLANCFITPHIAWASKNARMRLVEGLAMNIQAFVDGQPRNALISY